MQWEPLRELFHVTNLKAEWIALCSSLNAVFILLHRHARE